MYVALASVGAAFVIVPGLIRFNIMSGVFLSFFVALLNVAYIVWAVNRVASLFYAFGLSANPFFLLYSLSYGIITGLVFWLFKLDVLMTIGIGSLLHFSVVYLLLKLVFKK
jgi:hypothetical protein